MLDKFKKERKGLELKKKKLTVSGEPYNEKKSSQYPGSKVLLRG